MTNLQSIRNLSLAKWLCEGGLARFSALVVVLLGVTVTGLGQETTGSLLGTVKDPSGAVVGNAKVTVTSPTLVGGKSTETDAAGFYHFANLPPGAYVLTVDAKGFQTLKRTGLVIEVGHSPTVDLALAVGSEATVVEVTSATPQIDVTSTTTHTNITEDVIDNVPHGTSFQSAIEFAPSARNEPLQGMSQFSIGNGNGATSPGSGSSGNAYGFSIAGAADSENSYLVEGQETANLIGGNSHTNVPFDFIDEMVIDTNGVQAEHGGALGGVINVIMDKGTNHVHGAVWVLFNEGAMNGSPRATSRYDPNGNVKTLGNGAILDAPWQQYQPKKYHTSDTQPGFRIGLPLVSNKVFLFAGFDPEWSNEEHTVTYNHAFATTYASQNGKLSFGQNTQTYYTNIRVDAAVGKRVHLFGSLLDQGQHQSGESLPNGDDVHGLFNVSSSVNPIAFEHSLGYAAPNTTYNLGLDYTASSSIVFTSRFGYFFENYHDLGYPTNGVIYDFYGSGAGGTDTNGKPLPSDLQEPVGYFNTPNSQTYTLYNADKRTQFDQDVAFYKSTKWGTHNFKVGYQLNKSNNNIYQRWNEPYVEVFPGSTESYSPAGSTGKANCATVTPTYGGCNGQYGYIIVQDYGTKGQATSFNHAFYGQDSWSLPQGLTINYGMRFEYEYVPSENNVAGLPTKPITFGWNDKVAPRAGFSWDPKHDGKMKIFGGYGSFTDMMKLNIAIGSFGGQYWQNCAYALSTDPLTNIDVAFDANSRYCTGDSTGQANFGEGPGLTPTGLTFLENVNERGTEGVVNGLKPYRQHETTLGYDYQIQPKIVVEARWDRRRLDHAIEDAALFDSFGDEIFTIVNPGEGPNAFNSTCQTAGTFVDTSTTPPTSYPYAACPPDIKAARAYDGLELRVSKQMSNHWAGMFSYTYSNFRGNYYGLTSSDEADGGGGRNAPNNSRAFDETYFQYNAYGGSSSGKLATDRPNALKGYAYYTQDEGHKTSTTLGLFQDAYSGTPVSTYLDTGYSIAAGGNGGEFAVYPEGRGKWVDATQSASTGVITVGNAYTKRTAWFTQTDVNIKQTFKVTESQAVSFDATITNALNQHEIVAYTESLDTTYQPSFIAPGGVAFYYGGIAYSDYEHPYPWKTLLNTDGVTENSQYGKPYEFQVARNIRLALHYTF